MTNQHTEIICAGSVLWDIIGSVETDLSISQDKPGAILRRPGGVAFNIAQKLSIFGLKPIILSAIGNDAEGNQLIDHCKKLGFDMRFVHLSSKYATDRYMAIEDKSGLFAAVADIRCLELECFEIIKPLTDGRLGSFRSPSNSIIIADGNLPSKQLFDMAKCSVLSNCALKLAPASAQKVERLKVFCHRPSTVLYCNLSEAEFLAGEKYENSLIASRGLLDIGFHRVLVTNGPKFACEAEQNMQPIIQTPNEVKTLRVTGAGDVFMASHINAELTGSSRGEALAKAITEAGNYVSARDCT